VRRRAPGGDQRDFDVDEARAVLLGMRVSFVVAVAFAAAGSSGCMHISSEVPGVLDLRSDGADAPVKADALPSNDASRSGFGAFFSGAGAQGSSDVTIEDRNTLVAVGPLILMSVVNSSSTEEWRAALGNDGALRNVTLGEQISIGAFGATLVKGICLCPVIGGWVAPTIDFKASGTRIGQTASGAASERETSIPPALPADGSAGTSSPTSVDGDVNY
jgi:hypothetical protein